MRSGIYMVKNPIGQMYIGQSKFITERFKLYKRMMEVNWDLYQSMLKYGVKNHEFIVIEYCEVLELNEKESYYIRLYDTFNTPHGFNKRRGGGYVRQGKNI